eukprot:3707376-Pyramimonas_sp.AAC.1
MGPECSSDSEYSACEMLSNNTRLRFLLYQATCLSVAIRMDAMSAAAAACAYESRTWNHLVSDVLPHRGRQLRDLQIMSLCSGMGPEIYALHKLGYSCQTIACDMKNDSKLTLNLFPARGLGPAPRHMFGDVFEMMDGLEGAPGSKRAMCSKCGGPCNPIEGDMIVDILVAGFPCQPYTAARRKRFANDDDVAAHKKYDVSIEMVRSVKIVMPASFIFENVVGFARRGVNDIRPTPLDHFMEQLRAIEKYHVEAFQLELGDWVNHDRDRREFSSNVQMEGERIDLTHIVFSKKCLH